MDLIKHLFQCKLAVRPETLSLFIMSILCGLSMAAPVVVPPQHRVFQRMQIHQELVQVSQELAEKNQYKLDLESQQRQLISPLSVAKALGLASKSKQLTQVEAQIKNQLQQLDIDIKELKSKQAAMTASLAK